MRTTVLAATDHPLIAKALAVLEAEIVGPAGPPKLPSTARRWAPLCPAGGSVRLLNEAMDAIPKHFSPMDGTQLARDRRQRGNRARTAWYLVDADTEDPIGAGYFDGSEKAEDYARERGWQVLA